MPDLSAEGMAKWRSVLPDDILSCMGTDGGLGSGELIRVLKTAAPDEVSVLLPLHAADVEAFGRARRLRLMAWTLSGLLSDDGTQTNVLADLIGEDDEGSGGKRGEVSRILYEDYLAFVTAIGPRAARAIVNAASVDQALDSVVGAREELRSRMGAMS